MNFGGRMIVEFRLGPSRSFEDSRYPRARFWTLLFMMTIRGLSWSWKGEALAWRAALFSCQALPLIDPKDGCREVARRSHGTDTKR